MPRLYGITPAHLNLRKVEAALAGGCGWLQYRNKIGRGQTGEHDRRQREAQQLLDLCENYGAKLIINDDLNLAAAIGAHGVHLGQQDTAAATARATLGADAIIGVTCHADLTLAHRAQDAGASYVAFGRFFTSTTKPGTSAAPLDILTRARQELDLPIVAIGGINLANAAAILAAGADTLAVCGGLFNCENPGAQARAFCEIQGHL